MLNAQRRGKLELYMSYEVFTFHFASYCGALTATLSCFNKWMHVHSKVGEFKFNVYSLHISLFSEAYTSAASCLANFTRKGACHFHVNVCIFYGVILVYISSAHQVP